MLIHPAAAPATIATIGTIVAQAAGRHPGVGVVVTVDVLGFRGPDIAGAEIAARRLRG